MPIRWTLATLAPLRDCYGSMRLLCRPNHAVENESQATNIGDGTSLDPRQFVMQTGLDGLGCRRKRSPG
jgi:hypothetical protein